MPPANLPRRRLLQSAAAASGLVGVSFAGCTDLADLGEGGGPGPDRDRPAYAPYVPSEGLFEGSESAGAVGEMYVHVDFETLAAYEEFDVEERIATPEGPIEGTAAGDVAFAAGPTMGLLVYVFGMFGLVGYSFSGDLLPSFGDQGDEGDDGGGGSDSDAALETSVSVLTSFGYVFVGDYDVDALGEAAEAFEAVEEREGFTVFEGQTGDDAGGFSLSEGLAFAASADAVMIPLPDTSDDSDDSDGGDRAGRNREMVETMIDVASGSAETAADSDGDVDWLLRTTGHGAFGIGTFGGGEELTGDGGMDDGFGGGTGGGDDEFFDEETVQALEDIGALLADATLYGSSIELESEDTAVGHVALAYDDGEDVPSDDEFEAVFGDVSGEFSMESSERRVYLRSTQSLETTGV